MPNKFWTLSAAGLLFSNRCFFTFKYHTRLSLSSHLLFQDLMRLELRETKGCAWVNNQLTESSIAYWVPLQAMLEKWHYNSTHMPGIAILNGTVLLSPLCSSLCWRWVWIKLWSMLVAMQRWMSGTAALAALGVLCKWKTTEALSL